MIAATVPTPLELAGAQLEFFDHWLGATAADTLFAALLQQIPWDTHRIRMFGRLVDSPRLSCWIGDPGTDYTYSGVRFAPRAWPVALRLICERLAREVGVDFNSVLANRYRDGRDSMGWHSDDERSLGKQPVIASLSLGATRRFVLRHRHDATRKLELELEHGSLLVMAGDTQLDFQHALPKTARPVGERINLTFRRIVGQGNSGQR